MDIKFKDTFFDNIRKLKKDSMWYMKKIWNFCTVDFPRFVRNVYLFRESLMQYRWYDYDGTLSFMKTSIEDMAKNIKSHGIEIYRTRNLKIKKMNRSVEILNHILNDNYIELAEKKIGKIAKHDVTFVPSKSHEGMFEVKDTLTSIQKKHQTKVFELHRKIEIEEWCELWDILKGKEIKENFEEEFDGTNLREWWD